MKEKIVTEQGIQFELSKLVNLPAEQVAEKETENLANLEKNIKGSVYGQDSAVEDIVDKILVTQAGLKDQISQVLLCLWSTGTGKTETAKQLAHSLGVKLVRFDMSEYSKKNTVAKLLGHPVM